MDINELLAQAESKIGDNKELGSVFGEIKSAVGSIVTKKDELLEKHSTLNTAVKELGGHFGVQKESSSDILSGIREAKDTFETKINTLSSSEEGLATKFADLESRFNEQSKAFTAMSDETKIAKQEKLLSDKKVTLGEHLAKANIKSADAQKAAIALLKDEHGDLLSIENGKEAEIVKKFAENNPRLVDSKINPGVKTTVTDVDPGAATGKETPAQRQARMKEKYGLSS